ncbi:hypothetical protein RHGRI_037759 [Rhododendron griersonianum]|uniref:Fe2OG dioxygenase domain-containing protein n=1 Tax=Rhododendron griersonianum TaxID=479676 RepID=A0AAV6HTH8_9ERIC|nr:hypothetical protein RHGRI_037759 [Rhododendron griersonianum]
MESPKALGLGSSLMSVQELAKEPMFAIPQPYIRSEEEPSIPSHGSDSPQTIPVIDMNQLVFGQTDLEVENLHFACKEWGFFQLVNHGVESSVVEKLRNEIQEFYKLPLEEKMIYKCKEGDAEGYGQTILKNEDQTVDWEDRFYMITNPVHRRKAHLIPELPSSLGEALESYICELQKLGMPLLGMIGKALNIGKGEMEELFEDGLQSVRMTYYPPCPQPEKVMGRKAHTDAAGITIILQINGVQGLQVKRDGIWIPVNVLPDAFVVNVGDVLEVR